MKSVLALLSACIFAVSVGSASAVTVPITRITDNGTLDASSQIIVDVTDGGSGAWFDISAILGTLTSFNIAEIYFDLDGGILLNEITVVSNNGTSFSPLNNLAPGDLPAGGDVGFEATTGIDSDVSGPPSQRPFPSSDGLNINDSLRLHLAYGGGFGFADVLAGLADGSVRFGFHVRAHNGGDSESYVNGTPPPTIPVPAGGLLLLAGLGGLMAMRRRAAA